MVPRETRGGVGVGSKGRRRGPWRRTLLPKGPLFRNDLLENIIDRSTRWCRLTAGQQRDDDGLQDQATRMVFQDPHVKQPGPFLVDGIDRAMRSRFHPGNEATPRQATALHSSALVSRAKYAGMIVVDRSAIMTFGSRSEPRLSTPATLEDISKPIRRSGIRKIYDVSEDLHLPLQVLKCALITPD
jgi:hypothetical protein